MAVSGQITGATEAVALWNEQYGDNARIQIYGKNSQGIIWAINPDGSFKEYPVQVADDPEKVFKFVNGQQFGLIPGSEKATVVWSGEKLIVVRNGISLASGGKAYLEYFDIWTREWKLNPNTLAAQLPADQQNLVPFQNADGQWLAGASAGAEPTFQWNAETNSWVKIEQFDWDAAAVQMENYGNAIGGECIMPAEDLAANWHEVILIFENQPLIPEGNKTFAMARTLDKDGNWIEVKVLLQEEENGVNKNRFAIVFLYGLNGDFDTGNSYTKSPTILPDEELQELIHPEQRMYKFFVLGADEASKQALRDQGVTSGGQIVVEIQSAAVNGGMRPLTGK